MYSRPKILIVPILLIFLFLISCRKKEEYSIIPDIKFENLVFNTNKDGRDSIAVLTISFTDGDGDIGLSQSDSTTNFFINFFSRQDGILKQAYDKYNKPITFNSIIPIITPKGKNKNIKGEISIDMDFSYLVNDLTKPDTIALEVYIIDRALHKSNVIITPEYIITK